MLEKRELKPTDEFRRLVNLFNAQWDKNLYEKTSLKNFINGHLPQLPIRQTYLLVDEILSDLNISEDALYEVQWTTLFTYCELLFNLINQARGFIKKDEAASTFAKVIEDNIATILIKTNHRWVKIKEGYVIVDNDLVKFFVFKAFYIFTNNLFDNVVCSKYFPTFFTFTHWVCKVIDMS